MFQISFGRTGPSIQETLVHLETVSMKVCLPGHQGVGKRTWSAPFRLDTLGPQEASGEEGGGKLPLAGRGCEGSGGPLDS